MKRRLFTLGSTFSLLLFITTATLWTVAELVSDDTTVLGRPTLSQLQQLPPGTHMPTTEFGVSRSSIQYAEATYHVGSWEILGEASLSFRIPCWAVLLATATLPSIWLIGRGREWLRRRKTLPIGFSVICTNAPVPAETNTPNAAPPSPINQEQLTNNN